MAFKVVIPARYASTRLPGKPLLDIAGKPMIIRVAEQAVKSGASEIVIATDFEKIVTVAKQHGFKKSFRDLEVYKLSRQLSTDYRLPIAYSYEKPN